MKLTVEQKLESIKKYLEEASDNEEYLDKYKYIIPGLMRLFDMAEECDQHDINFDSSDFEPIFTTRVFRCKRYVPDYILSCYGVHTAKICGMFIELPCWILPADRVNKANNGKRRKKIISMLGDPVDYGLPSTNQALYGTIRNLSPNSYIVLAKIPRFDLIGDWIYTASHIEYFYLR